MTMQHYNMNKHYIIDWRKLRIQIISNMCLSVGYTVYGAVGMSTAKFMLMSLISARIFL